MKFTTLFVLVLTLVLTTASFSQDKNTVASNLNSVGNGEGIPEKSTDAVVSSLRTEEYCNTGVQASVKVETILKDGKYAYRVFGVNSVMLYTNEYKDNKRSHSFTGNDKFVEITEDQINLIKKNDKTSSVTFDVLRNGKFAFVSNYHPSFK